MPGVPNAVLARQVERAGFDALYISGAGMANTTVGVPDIGLLTLTEVVQLAGYIVNAVGIRRRKVQLADGAPAVRQLQPGADMLRHRIVPQRRYTFQNPMH